MEELLDKEKEIKDFLQSLLSSKDMDQFLKLFNQYWEINQNSLIKVLPSADF